MRSKIKRNNCYVQKTVAGSHYLLPYGQMIADFKKGMVLNDTGKWLFSILEEPLSRTQILKMAIEYYEVPKEAQKELKEDINAFLNSLIKAGILLEETDIPKDAAGGVERLAYMCGMELRFSCQPRFFPPMFEKFTIKEGTLDPRKRLNITITEGKPLYSINGELIIRFEELIVLKASDRYVLFFPKAKGVIEAHLSLKGTSCIFYISGDTSKEAIYDLFRSIRVPALFAARLQGKVAVHSASILYKDRVWLFSAPSGVGKSYHTFMWNNLYKTPLVNGDTSVIGLDEEGEPAVYGAPWCGTSDICDTRTHKLGGIILIRRGRTDFTEELSESEKRLLVLQRLISPSWDEKAILKNLKMVEDITQGILVCRLNCTMNKTAVEAIKSRIDRYLKGR